MVRKALSLSAAFVILATALLVQAQDTCEGQRERGGDSAVERCKASEREERARRRVEDYKNQIELDQDRIESFYEREKDVIEHASEEADFELEHEIRELDIRRRQLRDRDRSSLEAERISIRIDELNRRRSFLRSAKDDYIRKLQDRADLEISTLEFDLSEFELSVRGLPSFFQEIGRYYYY